MGFLTHTTIESEKNIYRRLHNTRHIEASKKFEPIECYTVGNVSEPEPVKVDNPTAKRTQMKLGPVKEITTATGKMILG